MQNAQMLAADCYAKSAAPIRTPRNTEYEAVSQITRSLKQALAKGRNDAPKLAEAIHRNRQLWSVLAASVAEGENMLSDDLRAGLFSLAEFVRKHSAKVLMDGADGSVLVEINLSIMQGLNARVAK